MHLQKLELLQFNNYSTLDVDFHQDMNAITGQNGMGKTNVLDAVYYLCIGKSYFSSGDRYVVQKGESFFRCVGMMNSNNGEDNIEIVVKPGKSKTISLSGKKKERLSDHVGQFPCVIISPIDIQLMMDGSEERRKFLDTTIMQYNRSYVDSILAYNRLLKQRNAMLKMFAEKHYFDPTLLESISSAMYKPAAVIYEYRQNMAESITPLFTHYYQLISGGKEQCEVEYVSQLADVTLEVIFEKNIERDKILNRTSSGIHKDDLVLSMNGSKLKNFASQGQLKSVVLALKLAQYEILSKKSKELPILMLDDIFDKLDRERVEQLIDIVSSEAFGQVFISDTNSNRLPEILAKKKVNHSHFVVNDGKIEQI